MPSRSGPVGWRLFWRYQVIVFRETGWPPIRSWIGSIGGAAAAGGVQKIVTGDWSWLVPVSVGVVIGLLFYLADLARASARLHGLQERQIAKAKAEEEARIPRRQGDALLRRWDELRVDFDKPSRYDQGSYRSAAVWDEKFERFMEALGKLEDAAPQAPEPQYSEYLDLCRDIRDVLRHPAQHPKGKWHYLDLSESCMMERLERLVRG